jgi:hypothetical protein
MPKILDFEKKFCYTELRWGRINLDMKGIDNYE